MTQITAKKYARAAPNIFSAIAVLIFIVSILYQIQQGTTVDVSWLITLSERLLDGQTAYVDFYEMNPPASILLYVPAVAAARLLHVAPEAAIKASIYLLFAANLLLLKRILHPQWNRAATRLPALAAAAAAIFLLVPGDVFAQREHFIAILLLPILAVLAIRAQDGVVPGTAAVLAGLEAGLAIDIKPYFVLAVALPWLFVMARRRASRRDLLQIATAPELIVIVMLMVAYAAIVFLCFPAFITKSLPIVVDVYGLYFNPHLAFLHSWNAVLWYIPIVLIAATAARSFAEPLVAVPLLASLGCFAAIMIQQKYFDYHAYPAISLSLASLASATCGAVRQPARGSRLVAGVRIAGVFAAIAAATVWFAARPANHDLLDAMRRLKPHPRLMAMAMGHGLAHPLVRQLDGTFVGRLHSPWMYFLIKRAIRDPTMSPEQRRKLDGYIALEKRLVAEDLAQLRPDYILVAKEFDTDQKVATWPFIDENWIRSTPALVAAFAAYRVRQVVRRVEIWERREASGN